MNKPGVSLEALTRLEDMERDRAMEAVLARLGFTGSDVSYAEVDGERQLVISRNAYDYVMAHKQSMRRKLEKAAESASIKALEAGFAIIELQKIGGKK
jgi:hypothetical protein